MTLGPPVAGFELDSEKVSDFAINTVLNDAQELSIGVAHPERRSLRDGPVELQTGAGKRDIFQIRNSTTGPPAVVLPLHVHQVRTEHPRFNTPVEHFSLNSVSVFKSVESAKLCGYPP